MAKALYSWVRYAFGNFYLQQVDGCLQNICWSKKQNWHFCIAEDKIQVLNCNLIERCLKHWCWLFLNKKLAPQIRRWQCQFDKYVLFCQPVINLLWNCSERGSRVTPSYIWLGTISLLHICHAHFAVQCMQVQYIRHKYVKERCKSVCIMHIQYIYMYNILYIG